MRGRQPGRIATADDLNIRQRAIYDALPADLRWEYLEQLPRIVPVAESSKKRITVLEDRVQLVEGLIASLIGYQREVQDVIQATKDGHPSAREVDLRKLLAPPDLEGAVLRFQRTKQQSRTGRAQEEVAASEEEPRRRRRRKTEAPAEEPSEAGV